MQIKFNKNDLYKYIYIIFKMCERLFTYLNYGLFEQNFKFP